MINVRAQDAASHQRSSRTDSAVELQEYGEMFKDLSKLDEWK